MSQKWTAENIPQLRGRVAVITGANTGIGLEIAKALASRGASVVLAVRNEEKGRRAMAVIARLTPGADVTVQKLDLASLDSIHAAAGELLAKHSKIDLLINNAGVLYPPRTNTADGFELQFGTNHLGHFAFTGLLLPRMLAVAGSRVVTVSSLSHRFRASIHFDDLQWEHSYDRMAAYSQSKLANLIFAYELQRRLAESGAETISLAAHPGTSRTDIMRNSPLIYRAATLLLLPVGAVFMQSARMGALPILRAATDVSVLGGQYYGPGGRWPREFKGYPELVKSSTQSHDRDMQRRLWVVSEELTGVKFPV